MQESSNLIKSSAKFPKFDIPSTRVFATVKLPIPKSPPNLLTGRISEVILTEMASSCKYIPSEILIDNVLPRLPIKTLIRCTSVCKSWYSLLRNPKFIQNHLNHRSSSGCLLVMPSPSENYSNNICSVLCEDTFSVLENFDFEFPFEVWYVAYKMGICCNGLICLTEAYDFVVDYICLCNPSIRKVKKICSSPVTDMLCNSGEVVISAMGFGFDEVANDYKVVRVYDYTSNFKAYEFEVHAEVYSLRKDEWKQIEASEWYFDGKSLPANGAIHWLTKNVIIAFDLHDETFHKIELPKESYITEEKCLLLYKGSLAFLGISVAENRDRTHVDIWVMKVYGVTDSWTRQFNGVIEGASLKYFKFTRSGKLIYEREGNMLASWDPETLQIVDLGFEKHEHKVVDEYVESLILL